MRVRDDTGFGSCNVHSPGHGGLNSREVRMSKQRRDLFKDKEHLVRMAGIFAVGVVVFLGLQALLVPKTFGLYGHYRAAAITEVAAQPMSYAGRASCAACHQPVLEVQ